MNPLNSHTPHNHIAAHNLDQLDLSTITYKDVEYFSISTITKEMLNLSTSFDAVPNQDVKNIKNNNKIKQAIPNNSKELFDKQIVSSEFINEKQQALKPLNDLD